jgi:hypothetical protein
MMFDLELAVRTAKLPANDPILKLPGPTTGRTLEIEHRLPKAILTGTNITQAY